MRDEIAEVMRRDQVMELVYGNNHRPKDILGRHLVRTGQVISAYHPDAVEMYVVRETGVRYRMDPVERHHLFAVFFSDKTLFDYKIDMVFPDGNHFLSEDPYSFPSLISRQEETMFTEGVWENCYKKLGAHPATIHGTKGVYFAVWAPNARRVSVVGDFNYWNGMIYPMQKLENSGIFELFLPGVKDKALYRFEVKTWETGITQKVDPFGTINLDGNGDASIVLDVKDFRWDDHRWMRDRRQKDWLQGPVVVCDREVDDLLQEDSPLGGLFTHALFQAPAFCHGMRGKVRERVNALHQRGKGVLVRLSLGWFPDEENGLRFYDGTMLFGHTDPELRFEKGGSRIRFRHDKKEIINYLTSHLLYWIREFHIDGFLIEGVTEMVCPLLDSRGGEYSMDYDLYQKESEDFLRYAVEMVKREDFSVVVIADEEREAGFEYEELVYHRTSFDELVNHSIPENLRKYMASSGGRSDAAYYRLSLPLMKEGIQNSLLDLAPAREFFGDRACLDNGYVNEYDRLSWSKLMIGYMLGIPGKKRWSRKSQESVAVQQYLTGLMKIYMEHPCMYHKESKQSSFIWINGMDARNRVLSFMRRSSSGGRNLLFLCNFDREKKVGYRVGVPKFASYRLLLNSDWEEFGGAGKEDPVALKALSRGWDLLPYSLRVTVPGLSVLIFEF